MFTVWTHTFIWVQLICTAFIQLVQCNWHNQVLSLFRSPLLALNTCRAWILVFFLFFFANLAIMLISCNMLHCVFQLCVWGQDTFSLYNWSMLERSLPLSVTCCIMGWPKIACCGLFCNCDEGVTQMLSWTLMWKYCFRWMLRRMIRHSVWLWPQTLVGHREWCPSWKAPTYTWTKFLMLSPPVQHNPSASFGSPTLHPHLRAEGGGQHQSRDVKRTRFSGTGVSLSRWFNSCSSMGLRGKSSSESPCLKYAQSDALIMGSDKRLANFHPTTCLLLPSSCTLILWKRIYTCLISHGPSSPRWAFPMQRLNEDIKFTLSWSRGGCIAEGAK